MKAEQHLLALPEGYRLDKYVVEGVLGSGGFGITYLAEESSLGRRVAIKELLPGDFATRVGEATVAPKGRETDRENFEWARARFLEEGRVLAACKHPNVVEVYGAFTANGTAYLVTCYEEGQDFERWLRGLGRPPNEAELRAILWPLLSGLERVHQAGFLHRDIKPENIYRTAGGRPVLLDFGSARQAIGSRSRMLTAVITAGYAPFEQYHEGGQQGPWTDIYALGAVMHRAITGQKPPEAAARMMGNDPYQSLAANQAARYSPAFLKGLDRALRVKASERPQSIAQWRTLLGEGPAGETTKLPPLKRLPGWVWWLGGAALAGLALALALAGLALWFVNLHPKSEPAPSLTPGSVARATPAPSLTPGSIARATPALSPTLGPSVSTSPAPTFTPVPSSTSTGSPASDLPLTVTPSPQPAPTPTPTPYTPAQSSPVDSRIAVLAFVKNFWSHSASNDAGDWASDFADQARYCYYSDSRLADRRFIRQDRAKLVDRYPVRHYEFSDPSIQMQSGDDSARVSFNFNYLYSGRKSAAGTCRVALTVEWNSGRWYITDYDEKVYRQ